MKCCLLNSGSGEATVPSIEENTRRRVRLNLTLSEVRQLAENQNLQVLQADPIDVNTWHLISEELPVRCPDVEIRVYGFYGLVCDLSFHRIMKELRRFSADSLHKAAGIEHSPLRGRRIKARK
jgi:hypothetical protein